MARTHAISDEQLIEQLRNSDEPLTAAALGVPAARLKAIEGVVVAGSVQTGRPGRPSLLFSLSA